MCHVTNQKRQSLSHSGELSKKLWTMVKTHWDLEMAPEFGEITEGMGCLSL